MPRVSVIIPIYNSERYLSQAIQSVQSHTFDDIEILLLDDGSQDGSIEIATKAAKEDPRVIFI
jgi:glycosyltransferase involved in cell wall biosynthesis